MVYTYNVVFSHKQELNTDNTIHAQWKKPSTKDHIVYDSIYVKYQNKWIHRDTIHTGGCQWLWKEENTEQVFTRCEFLFRGDDKILRQDRVNRVGDCPRSVIHYMPLNWSIKNCWFDIIWKTFKKYPPKQKPYPTVWWVWHCVGNRMSSCAQTFIALAGV